MPKILDQFTYRPRHIDFVYRPSLTVPDQALTVKEHLARYQGGKQLLGFNNPVYTDGNDLVPPNFEMLDPMERADQAAQWAAEAERQRNVLQQKARKVNADQAEAEIEKRVNEKLKLRTDATILPDDAS